MKYLILPFVLMLGMVELVLRVTALGCLIILTLAMGVVAYVGANPEDFKDLMTPVCFKLAEKMVK